MMKDNFQFSIAVEPAAYECLEQYRFNNRITSRSKAVAQIIYAGMEALKDEYPELDLQAKRIELKQKELDMMREQLNKGGSRATQNKAKRLEKEIQNA